MQLDSNTGSKPPTPTSSSSSSSSSFHTSPPRPTPLPNPRAAYAGFPPKYYPQGQITMPLSVTVSKPSPIRSGHSSIGGSQPSNRSPSASSSSISPRSPKMEVSPSRRAAASPRSPAQPLSSSSSSSDQPKQSANRLSAPPATRMPAAAMRGYPGYMPMPMPGVFPPVSSSVPPSSGFSMPMHLMAPYPYGMFPGIPPAMQAQYSQQQQPGKGDRKKDA